MVQEIIKTNVYRVWIARGHLDHILVAGTQEFAKKVFEGKYGYSPTIMLEVEYYGKPLGPNVIQPKVLS